MGVGGGVCVCVREGGCEGGREGGGRRGAGGPSISSSHTPANPAPSPPVTRCKPRTSYHFLPQTHSPDPLIKRLRDRTERPLCLQHSEVEDNPLCNSTPAGPRSISRHTTGLQKLGGGGGNKHPSPGVSGPRTELK